MNEPLNIEISIDMTQNEVACHRQAITQTATDEEWQAAAIQLFESLRARHCKYQVRQLAVHGIT